MSKIAEAQDILRQLGEPERQQHELSALTLLGITRLSEDDPWSGASELTSRVPTILEFINDVYGKEYPEKTRGPIQRRLIRHFLPARNCGP